MRFTIEYDCRTSEGKVVPGSLKFGSMEEGSLDTATEKDMEASPSSREMLEELASKWSSPECDPLFLS